MFARRKRNYKVFVYTALVITICILIIFLFWPAPIEEPDTANKEPITEPNGNAYDSMYVNDNKEDEIQKDETANADIKTKEENITDLNPKTYYIVKKNGNTISVYFVTEDGIEIKLEDTEIIYELLTVEDQASFKKGIIIESQEALSSLLQDFEG